MANKRYSIMQMRFAKGCDWSISDCGIDRSEEAYKPKCIGSISISTYEKEKAFRFIINKNQKSRGRKYDIVFYLVSDEDKDKTTLKKEYTNRDLQEIYMSDFFNSNDYLNALRDSDVLDKLKSPKDLNNCIHTKFCNLTPSDYTMLGFPCLDIDSLNDIESSVVTISTNLIVADFNTELDYLEDTMDKKDFEKLETKLADLNMIVADIKDYIVELKSKVDEDGFYTNKKGNKNGK